MMMVDETTNYWKKKRRRSTTKTTTTTSTNLFVVLTIILVVSHQHPRSYTFASHHRHSFQLVMKSRIISNVADGRALFLRRSSLTTSHGIVRTTATTNNQRRRRGGDRIDDFCSRAQIVMAFANYIDIPILSRASPTTQYSPLKQRQHYYHPSNSVSFPSPHLDSSKQHHRHYLTTRNPCNSISASATPTLFLQPDSNNNSGEEEEENSWKELTNSLNEVLELPSISFPAKHVHHLLSDKNSPIQPYLATQMIELEGVHPKIKLVREETENYHSCCDVEQQEQKQFVGENSGPRRKRILLDSRLLKSSILANVEHYNNSNKRHNNTLPQPSPLPSSNDKTLMNLIKQYPGIPPHILQRFVHEYDAQPVSDLECIHIPYQHQPITRILPKILPTATTTSSQSSPETTKINEEPSPPPPPPPSSYEQIGHVAHFNLRQPHLPYGKLIGRVMLDRLQPTIRTVVNKLGEVGGPYRTYTMELLAGVDDYFVHVVEHGISLHFDLRKVYWCTRLEGERTYMIQNEFQPNQRIADAFCGVGALCIRAAIAKGCTVVANDLNPDAVAYCMDSARRNGIDVSDENSGIDNGKFHVQCGDASQFIMNLGMDTDDDDDELSPTTKSNLPHHLLLNFPLDSPHFLNALRWWPSSSISTTDKCKSSPTTTTRVHVYTFSRGDGERSASEVAIDMVADGLLPEGGYVEQSKFRGGYLNELGCNIQAREIRDAAPGKMVICVSFSVTRLLLRRMQGDYGLIRD